MDPKFQVGSSLPQSVGACADLYNDIRVLRRAMQAEVDAIAKREREIEDYIIETLARSEDTGASGKRYRAQIKSSPVPTVKDWSALHTYIQETGRFDLLQKRVSDKAVTDTWEHGEELPGVGRFNKISLSVTKI